MRLEFNHILSENTHYGIIWEGLYEGKKCVMKVVILNTGIHYNKLDDSYYDGKKKISHEKAMRHIDNDGPVPFLYHKYKKRKAMSESDFHHEVNMMKKVSKLHLAPKVYGSWIENKGELSFGIIVMEKLECTVKDIILRRVIRRKELNLVISKINLLHQYKIKHGDLKPSNIGVKLDRDGFISKIRIIDWGKGEKCTDPRLYERDIETFHNHLNKNVLERNF